MVEQNFKMDILINRLDMQEWFMKEMAQMLFGESFGKFGDFGNYPHGTAGPSNAKAARPIYEEKSIESSSSHTKSNSSSENGKSTGINGSRQEEEKDDADNKKEGQSQDPFSDQLNPAPITSQPIPESSISLPMQYGPRRTKAQAKKSVLPIPPKIQVTIPEKELLKKKKQAKTIDPTHLRRSGRILSSKDKP
ncbi:hypothetical protein GH714_016311 [Hevea brasiliensis]|uniref:Uncharacterized protein n=1 Tax=Hevea brasiliensis TaxID=3981 RepID=A0A6A6L2X3_HEVBR|nr:hypothetical protein GH714_016311 [Hevea brasiliensis]